MEVSNWSMLISTTLSRLFPMLPVWEAFIACQRYGIPPMNSYTVSTHCPTTFNPLATPRPRRVFIMNKLTNHSKNVVSKTYPHSSNVHRSNTFPLMKRNSPEYARHQMYGKGPKEANSCTLLEKNNGFLRLENAKGECFLARGVKYNKDADPSRKKIALVMLLRAAMNGSSHALEELYDCYRRGIGTTRNEKVATQLLKAFLQQSVEASFLDDLLFKASVCNENLSRHEFWTPSSAYREKMASERISWLCLPLGINRGYHQTTRKPSQRIFCFIPD